MDNITILWQSKRKIIYFSLFFYILYFVLGIFICWFCWFVLLRESLWYGLLATLLTIFFISEAYEALNLESITLTDKGLILKMKFNKKIFYPYGKFTIQSVIRGLIRFEEVLSFISNQNCKTFKMLNGYDAFGSFYNNQEFKELCTKHTNQALQSMNLQERANLYKLYQDNIEYIFNETRNHNVFTIDFSPYKAEIESYLRDKNE